MDFAFIKDRYDYELQRKEQLTASLTLPVGVLGGLGSLLALMARSFSYRDQVLTWFFGPVLCLAVAAFFVCAYHLWRAYHAQTYVYLPLLRALEEARGEWRAFYELTHAPDADDAFFREEFQQHIIEAADANTKSNDLRSKWMHQRRVWLFAVFCLAALAGIPYVADQVRF